MFFFFFFFRIALVFIYLSIISIIDSCKFHYVFDINLCCCIDYEIQIMIFSFFRIALVFSNPIINPVLYYCFVLFCFCFLFFSHKFYYDYAMNLYCCTDTLVQIYSYVSFFSPSFESLQFSFNRLLFQPYIIIFMLISL